MDGRSFCDVTNHKRAKESNMAAVFVGLDLSAVGTVWSPVVSLGRTHVTDTVQSILPWGLASWLLGWSRKLWVGSEKKQL